MERLFDEVKESLDNDLKSNFESIVNQNNIPYASCMDSSKSCYATFFASNQDIHTPKKKLNKFKLSHPTLKISYSLDRYPDFYEVKKILGSTATSDVVIKTYPILFFYEDLEPKWRNEITTKVKHWINTIFAKTMVMYKERYSMTLGLMMMEMYLETPEKMCITKFPTFQDLTFVTSSKPIEIVDSIQFINRQVELIENSPFFKGKT